MTAFREPLNTLERGSAKYFTKTVEGHSGILTYRDREGPHSRCDVSTQPIRNMTLAQRTDVVIVTAFLMRLHDRPTHHYNG